MWERRLTLTAEREGTVETLLRRELGCSAAVVRAAKGEPDGILLDGVHANTPDWAQPGQVLSIRVSDRTPGALEPAPGPLEMVYEDADLLVVNKAPGVAVHPSPGHHTDTLGNFLAYYYKAKGIPFVFRPVNRLDRGTSGLMAVARHAYAHEALKRRLHTGAFRRSYLAVCLGRPDPARGTVDRPIGRAEGSPLRREVRPDGARAVTHYRTLAEKDGRSLLRLELETGRTHQIRVHMAWLGCPLAGDFLYGTEDPALIPRTALHAAELSVAHPVTGEVLHLSAPLPEDMARLI